MRISGSEGVGILLEQRQDDSLSHRFGEDNMKGKSQMFFTLAIISAFVTAAFLAFGIMNAGYNTQVEENKKESLPAQFLREYWFEGKIYDPENSELLLDMDGYKRSRIYRKNGEFFVITFKPYGDELTFEVFTTPEDIFNFVKDDNRVRDKSHSELAQLFGLEYSEI